MTRFRNSITTSQIRRLVNASTLDANLRWPSGMVAADTRRAIRRLRAPYLVHIENTHSAKRE